MMVKFKFFALTIGCVLVLVCGTQTSFAQSSGVFDNFSPYTMYGIGVLNNGASMSKKIEGGVGIASANYNEINYLNPASLGSIKQRSALFSLGIESQNYYSTMTSKNQTGQSSSAKSVGNIISLGDIGLAIPLARGVGFSVALMPVSSVGYSSTIVSQNQNIVDNIGRMYYSYKGEGGIASVAGSVGVRVAKNFNVGASLIYYFGTIDRYYTAEVAPMLNPTTYKTIKTLETTNISKLGGSFGAMYGFRVSRTGYITLGATYQLQAKMNAPTDHVTVANSGAAMDTVRINTRRSNINLPQKFGAGVGFTSNKVDIELNYTFQDWKNAFETNFATTGVELTSQQELRFGLAYTPNRADIRNVFNRWTYKLGAHYGTSYLIKDGQRSDGFSISIGAGVPLKLNNPTKISFGLEYGQKGMRNNMLKENYFKVFVGFNFFGDDMWFEKRKFN